MAEGVGIEPTYENSQYSNSFMFMRTRQKTLKTLFGEFSLLLDLQSSA